MYKRQDLCVAAFDATATYDESAAAAAADDDVKSATISGTDERHKQVGTFLYLFSIAFFFNWNEMWNEKKSYRGRGGGYRMHNPMYQKPNNPYQQQQQQQRQ